jgi:hypothetical protein
MIDHLTIRVSNFEASNRFDAAFVFDPDGSHVEAVLHDRPAA